MVNVATYIFMFIIHLILTMFMAIDAGELLVIGGQMAFVTGDVPVVP